MQSVSEILSTVIKASGFTPDALCSSGRCYDFANIAIRILKKNGYSAQLMTSDSYIQSKGDNVGWVEESVLLENPHAWIYSNGKHYDALDTAGVTKPLDMKFFKSQIMSYHYPDREERAYRLQNFGEVYSRDLDKFVKKDLTEDSVTCSIPKFLYKWVRYDKFKKYLESKRLPVKKGYSHYIDSENNFVKGNSFTDKNHINRWSGDTLIRIDTSKISNKIFPIPGHRTYLKTMGMTNNNYDANAWKYESEEIDEYWIADVLDLSSAVIIKSYDDSVTSDIIEENFADGKKPGRKGLAKRMGVDCSKSVSELRKIAKKSAGERQRMAHWCANMKAGRQKSNESSQLTEDCDSMSEEDQIAAVKLEDGHGIKFISNPSLHVQLAAVKYNGVAIQYIKNPSEEVQLAAVKENGYAIRYIKNPSEEVQLAAVEELPIAIRYIQNPSEAAQLAAVKQYDRAIEDIKNPSLKTQIAAVEKNGWAIEYITNPSLPVQLSAINTAPGSIVYIRNPNPELFKDYSVKNNVIKYLLECLRDGEYMGDVLDYLARHQVDWIELSKIREVLEKKPFKESRDHDSMSEEEQIRAVQENPGILYEIDKPSERVQIAAVLNDYAAISYIKPYQRSPVAVTVSKIVGYPGTLFMSLGRDDLDPNAFQIPEVKTIVMRELLKYIKHNNRIEFLSLLGLLDELNIDWTELNLIKDAWKRKKIG